MFVKTVYYFFSISFNIILHNSNVVSSQQCSSYSAEFQLIELAPRLSPLFLRGLENTRPFLSDNRCLEPCIL